MEVARQEATSFHRYKYFTVITTPGDRYCSAFANEKTEAREIHLYICELHTPTLPSASTGAFIFHQWFYL